ncbi:MAG: hypothetical protein ABIJ97_17705, partial [Bacteroidota bacterium]
MVLSFRWNLKDLECNAESPQLPSGTGQQWMYSYEFNEKNWLNTATFGTFNQDFSLNSYYGSGSSTGGEQQFIVPGSGWDYSSSSSSPQILSSVTYANYYNLGTGAGLNKSGSTESDEETEIAAVEFSTPEGNNYFNVNKSVETESPPVWEGQDLYFTPDDDNAYNVFNLDYDFNGNILSLYRNGYDGSSGNNLIMDRLSYSYHSTLKNRLTGVSEGASASSYNTDFEYNHSYTYNNIGQMTAYTSSGYTQDLEYNSMGLVSRLHGTLGDSYDIYYGYNERGQRISKDDGDITTWYVYDAGGTILAIYEYDITKGLGLTEMPIYGASRLGTWMKEEEEYRYELRDHLGNVRAVIS